jgi:thioredoxin-related protein
MKRIIFLVGLLPFFCQSNYAQDKSGKKPELVWHTDATKAHELSVKTKKPIFGFFTGSDWCGWCKKLQNDVFSKPEFVAWAKKNVILLELDFPKRTQLPQELAQQNAGLQQAFRVQGYPTIWIFFMTQEGQEKKFLDQANKILKSQSEKAQG